MCEPRLNTRLIALALSAWGSVATAQDPLERIYAPMRQAQQAYEAALAEWQADSVRRGALPVRVSVSGMTIAADSLRVPASYLAEVEAVLRSELDATRGSFGAATDTLLSGITMSLVLRSANASSSEDDSWLARFGDIYLFRAEVDGRSLTHSTSAKAPIPGRLRTYLASVITRRLQMRTPAPVNGWTNAPQASPWSLDDRTIQYRQMRMSDAPVARACLDGAIAACRTALAIVPPGVDTVSAWYDAAALRARVSRAVGDTLRWPGQRAEHFACVRARDDAACRRVIARVRVESPTGRVGRGELLRRAIAAGGDDGWSRLVNAQTTNLDSLLQQVSGVPTDTLIAAWRADVLTGRPPSPAPRPLHWAVGSVSVLLLVGGTIRRGVRP